MKLVKYLIIPFVLLLSITTHAEEKITTSKIKELATSNSENASYLSKDGKVRYSVEHVMTDDGKVETRAKKQYLPAVTDGINRDKTSKFRIPSSAKKTAKYFAKGANHAMFLSMIIDVLGDGVDYVLDEKNNSVQYTKSNMRCSTQGFGNYKANSFEELRSKIYANKDKYFFDSKNVQLSHIVLEPDNTVYHYSGGNERSKVMLGSCVKQQQETKVMNDEEFAQAVIELAKADNAKAKKVMIDVAKQAVADGDYDKEIQKAVDELNDETKDDTQDNTSDSSNASSSDSTNTDSQDDTQATPSDNNGGNNNNNKFELPDFCDWAKHVCDFIDWFKKDPELPEPPDPQIPIDDKSDLANANINQKLYDETAQCPPPQVIALPIGDVAIPCDSLCLFFSKHSPFVVAIAYIIGAYIVMGRG